MSSKRVDIVKIKMIKESSTKYEARKVKNPWDLVKLARDFIDNSDREVFIVICLNTKNEPTNISTVSVGTLSSSLVHPREVFKTAILSNASKIILSHNHPSGNVEPSNEDDIVTERLIKCGEMLGIEVIDHIILADDLYYSYKENLRKF